LLQEPENAFTSKWERMEPSGDKLSKFHVLGDFTLFLKVGSSVLLRVIFGRERKIQNPWQFKSLLSTEFFS
jgi:hypothetical protein